MRFTKYPQSCAVIEGSDGRVLVDPGNFAMDAVGFDDFGAVDAVMFTHRHPDHLDDRALDAIAERDVPVYGNGDVADRIGDHVGHVTTVTAGERFTVAGFEIEPFDMPHVVMVDGSAGPPNTGYVLDGRLLHPGDSLHVDGLRIDAFALPIAGPSVSFRDAYVAVETTGAATAIPIHYDGFIADPHRFAQFCDITEVVVLEPGGSTDI